MDESSDGEPEREPAGQDEWVATMALLGRRDREAYRALRALAWKMARILVESETAN